MFKLLCLIHALSVIFYVCLKEKTHSVDHRNGPPFVSLYEKYQLLIFTVFLYFSICTFLEPKTSLVLRITFWEYLL